MIELLGGVLAAMTLVMLAAWLFGLIAINAGWTDVFWTWGSGAALAVSALWPVGDGPVSTRQWIVAAMAGAWAVRLGLYLTPRVATHPEDPRYAAFRTQWGARYPLGMLWVTLPQALATALLAVSTLMAAHRPGTAPDARDIAALAIFGAALGGEALADFQMKAFRANPANRGGIMDRGLWGLSRHPNYVFQWLGWLAYPVMALEPARPITWLTLMAPAVMYVLLRFVSGVPPLEAAMAASRGPAFAAYQARVPAFLPNPFRAKAIA